MTVIVPAFEDGEYYLQNKSTNRYADIEGPTNDSGAIIHQWDFHGYASQQWEFTLLTDGYYKIKSMHSNLYLTVQNNSSAQDAAVIQSAYTGVSGQQWKVELLANGHYKITPKCGESVNRVLACANYLINDNGIDVLQRLYVDDTNYKDEWIIDYAGFTIVNYYDDTVVGTNIIDLIDDANSFVSDIFYDNFGVRIRMKGVPIHYENAIADECTHTNSPCTDDCGTDCDTEHHKNIYRINSQLYNEPRQNNYIYVMWTNRAYGSYCGGDNNGHKIYDSAIALVIGGSPVVQFLTLDNGDDIEERQAKMALILAHEIAHVMGLPEKYILDTHTPDNNEMECIMDEYNSEKGLTLYDNILKGSDNNVVTPPFCASCTNELNALVSNKTILGN